MKMTLNELKILYVVNDQIKMTYYYTNNGYGIHPKKLL